MLDAKSRGCITNFSEASRFETRSCLPRAVTGTHSSPSLSYEWPLANSSMLSSIALFKSFKACRKLDRYKQITRKNLGCTGKQNVSIELDVGAKVFAF